MKNRIFIYFSVFTVLLTLTAFLGLFSALIWNGSKLFLTTPINIFEFIFSSNGIFFQIIGTFILALVAIPVAFFSSILFACWRAHGYFDKNLNPIPFKIFDSILQMLHAIPSVVWGIFGFAVFVRGFDFGKSWLSGGLTLGVLGIPFLVDTALTRVKQIPHETIQSAQALGLGKSFFHNRIIFPFALLGALAGLRVTLPRLLAETAPILFTACVFSGVEFPKGIKDEPILSLPYHIFVLVQDTYSADAVNIAWSAALILVCISAFFRYLVSAVHDKLEEKWFYRN